MCQPGNARPIGQVKTTFRVVIIVLGLGIRYWCVDMTLVQLTSFGAYCLFFNIRKDQSIIRVILGATDITMFGSVLWATCLLTTVSVTQKAPSVILLLFIIVREKEA